jgi:hypothetical protein
MSMWLLNHSRMAWKCVVLDTHNLKVTAIAAIPGGPLKVCHVPSPCLVGNSSSHALCPCCCSLHWARRVTQALLSLWPYFLKRQSLQPSVKKVHVCGCACALCACVCSHM